MIYRAIKINSHYRERGSHELRVLPCEICDSWTETNYENIRNNQNNLASELVNLKEVIVIDIKNLQVTKYDRFSSSQLCDSLEHNYYEIFSKSLLNWLREYLRYFLCLEYLDYKHSKSK